nr:Na(+)-translocating NADH-quinone reductase subunit C [Prolixibacteraceae bacterium]
MNRNGNIYTFLYASIMVVIVAAILSVAAISLKPFQKRNIEIEKKQNILASVNITAPKNEVETLYEQIIRQAYVINSQGEIIADAEAFTVDMKKEHSKPAAERLLPIYEAFLEPGGMKYIVPLYGTGLWGPIWGYLSFDS